MRPAKWMQIKMNVLKSLSHSRWDCKYHVVFVPKGRKKALYGKIREYLKPVFHELARQRSCEIVEGHIVGDHVHMCISIPPKYAVSEEIPGEFPGSLSSHLSF